MISNMRKEDDVNLYKVSKMPNYTLSLFQTVKSELKGNVIEIGAGLGNLTRLVEQAGMNITPSDKEVRPKRYCRSKLLQYDVTKKPKLIKFKYDTVLCINVLEHIHDDKRALLHMLQLLKEKGRLVMMVPAFQSLFGPLDEANKHYRRYSKHELRTKIEEKGFRVKKMHYVNLLGFFGWLYQNKILRKSVLQDVDLNRYDKMALFMNKVESVIPPFVGLSIFVVAEK